MSLNQPNEAGKTLPVIDKNALLEALHALSPEKYAEAIKILNRAYEPDTGFAEDVDAIRQTMFTIIQVCMDTNTNLSVFNHPLQALNEIALKYERLGQLLKK